MADGSTGSAGAKWIALGALPLAGLVALAGVWAARRVPRVTARLGAWPPEAFAGTLDRAKAATAASTAAPAAASEPGVTEGCPEGMLLVDGIWCPYVGHRCVDWIDQKRDRCRRYDEKLILCEGKQVPMRFCIDRYEYPNQAGLYPVVMTSWIEADKACAAEGKRLCTESEWTFACEGETKVPYPYGFARDTEACNIDRHYRDPDFDAFSNDWKIADEITRLDQRVASGSMARCVSPFGVHDMTGNVDEWVVNEEPKLDKGEDVSGLKGGYWGPIRARCRPVTNSHNRWFRFYQVGFRCCREPTK